MITYHRLTVGGPALTGAQLQAALEHVVESALEGYVPRAYRDRKVIHDAVHGSNMYEPVEVATIDLPLVQRLRRIRQLGMVLQVYPAGAHSRFDHSLGVCTLVGKLVDALLLRQDKSLFNEVDRLELRLAALLHDIGHMPFSHISEEVLRARVDFVQIRKDLGFERSAKEHEILGALMIRTKAFATRFIEPLKIIYPAAKDLDFQRIANYIVGTAPAEREYMARIISGVLDADKMDYILRDCHMTGLKMSVDIDRILQTVRVVSHQGLTTLSIELTGVSTVEQLLFDKLLLNMAVYHHQKVRATECLIKGLYEAVAENGVRVGPFDIQANPVDLVRITDDDVLTLEHSSHPDVRRIARRLTRRELLMRCVVLGEKYYDEEQTRKLGDGLGYSDFMGLGKDPLSQRQLREVLAKRVGVGVHEVWLDAPQPPPMTEAGNFVVFDARGPAMLLKDVFPVGGWLDSYNATKLRGYVFVPSEVATPATFEIARAFLRDELGLVVGPNAAGFPLD